MLSAINYSTFKTEGLTLAEFPVEKIHETLRYIYIYIFNTWDYLK